MTKTYYNSNDNSNVKLSSNNFNDQSFDEKLLEVLATLSDNSFRDGQQSLDKNRIPASHTVITMPSYQKFAETAQQTAKTANIQNYKLPGYEFWGGGQFGQPAEFLGENPFATLAALAQTAPDISVKALFRGRQGYGFEPVDSTTQRAAINASFENGVKELRIFDMMNEWTNLVNATDIALSEATKFEDGRKIIGCVCYTRPTDDGKMAWPPEKLAELAVKFAKKGVNVVEIKDYAGNLFSEKEAREWMGEHADKVSAAHIVKTIRDALDKAGYKNIPLHFHSHGQKIEALDEALEAGAEVVDVGIGKLSGHYFDGSKEVTNTLAFTNMRDMLEYRMKKHGFDINNPEYANHPILQSLGKIEEAIDWAVEPVMQSRREQLAILDKLDPKELRYHPMAGGAISALYGLTERFWAFDTTKDLIKTIEPLENLNLLPKNVTTTQDIGQEEHFLAALKYSSVLWERGGAFATVTPGAKICCEQSAHSVMSLLKGEEEKLILDYQNVIKGRYGFNPGVEQNIGDVALHKELLGTAGQELFPADQVKGLREATEFINQFAQENNVEFGKGNIPTWKEAVLIAALTKRQNQYNIAKSLFTYLLSGERTGKIEESRTGFDAVKTSKDLVLLAETVEKFGMEAVQNLIKIIPHESYLNRNKALAANMLNGNKEKSVAGAFQAMNQLLGNIRTKHPLVSGAASATTMRIKHMLRQVAENSPTQNLQQLVLDFLVESQQNGVGNDTNTAIATRGR